MRAPTVEELRDHARSNPTKVFHMDDGCGCLAHSLTGCFTGLNAIYHGTTNYLLPGAFVTFLSHLLSERTDDEYTGAELDRALSSIIDGESPLNVADTLLETRREHA